MDNITFESRDSIGITQWSCKEATNVLKLSNRIYLAANFINSAKAKTLGLAYARSVTLCCPGTGYKARAGGKQCHFFCLHYFLQISAAKHQPSIVRTASQCNMNQLCSLSKVIQLCSINVVNPEYEPGFSTVVSDPVRLLLKTTPHVKPVLLMFKSLRKDGGSCA